MNAPIACREFDVVSETGICLKLYLNLFAPREALKGEFRCRLEIVGKDPSEELYSADVAGIDGVQALLLAAMLGGAEIENIAKSERWKVPKWSLEDLLRLRKRRVGPRSK